MKYIFQIPIFHLMLWASGVSYATHSVALSDGKIEIQKNKVLSSSAGLVAQFLNNDAITQDARNKIQWAAMGLSIPGVLTSFDFFKTMVKDTRTMKTTYNSINSAIEAADEIILEAAKLDLKDAADALDFVRTNPRGADAWEECIIGDLEHLRKNKNYLFTVQEYLGTSSPLPRLHPNMTLLEEASIRFYTTNPGYKDLNKALRGEIPMTPLFQEQSNILSIALAKLPVSTHNSSNTYLWRIENLSDAQFNSEYVKGSIRNKPAFYSSTYSETAIIDASRNRSHNVLVRIKGKNGKLIEDTSTLPSEKEILFNKNTKFEVEDVGFSPHPDQDMFPGVPIKTVWLKEI
jgi:hypothetical protein